MMANKVNSRYVLFAVGIGLAMTFADIMGVSVALPTIGRDLHASLTELHWIINGVLLGMAIFVIAAGRLGDFWGHQKMFVTGVVAFSLASLIATFASTPIILILTSLFRGVAGVCITTSSSNVVMMSFPKEEQGAKVGLVMSIASLFMVVGPLLGGALTQYVSWRCIFLLNVPLGIVSLWLLKFANVPEQVFEAKVARWDYKGFVISMIALVALALGVMNFKFDIQTLVLILVAVTAGGILVRIEGRAAFPMLDFAILKNHTFALGCAILFSFQIIFFSSILWVIYFQNYIGFSAFQTGLISVPFGVLIILSAMYAGKAYDKYGVKKPLCGGLLVIVLGFVQLLFLIHTFPLWSLLLCDACSSAAAFFVTSPVRTYAIQSAANHNRGLTNAFLSWCRQTGGTIGLAVLTLVQNLGIRAGSLKRMSSHAAYFHGFYWAMCLVTALAVLALVLSLLIKPQNA